jgi:hypothetical protein
LLGTKGYVVVVVGSCSPELRIIISGGYLQRANIQQGQLTKISSRERVLFILILEFGNHWAPGKYNFFLWLVAHNWCPVLDSRPFGKKRASSSL